MEGMYLEIAGIKAKLKIVSSQAFSPQTNNNNFEEKKTKRNDNIILLLLANTHMRGLCVWSCRCEVWKKKAFSMCGMRVLIVYIYISLSHL